MRFTLPPGSLLGIAVEPRDGESADHLVRRFRRIVDRSGIVGDLRQRRHHLTRRERRWRKHRMVARREQQRRERQR